MIDAHQKMIADVGAYAIKNYSLVEQYKLLAALTEAHIALLENVKRIEVDAPKSGEVANA